jgi:hypothetical protein
MATDVSEVVENAEFDPERVLLNEEFVIDSDGVLSNLTYHVGDRFKFWEMFIHFSMVFVVSMIFFLALEGINGSRKMEVIQDGRCENLLGWKCPRSVPACEGFNQSESR